MIKGQATYSWIGFLFIVILSALQPVLASSAGIATFSGNPNVNGGNTCTLCHTGGVVPTVSLAGPQSVEAGSVTSYSLTMSGGQENLAGLNISASSGFLSASSPAIVIDGGELRHSQPVAVASSGGQWTFNFEAPASMGTATLYASVLSANGNGQMSGDNTASVTLVIDVTPAQKKLVPKAEVGGPYFGQPGEIIQFDGSNSMDGDGNIDRHLWDFGDNSDFTQGTAIAHAYSAEGTYTVTLAVTDNDGLTGAAATSVTVSSNAGSAQGEALYNQKCFACHGVGGAGGSANAIIGTTVDQVVAAMSNVSVMQGITLAAEETQFIVDYLVSGGGEPPVRPADGPGLYSMFCSVCHGADGRGGSEIGVTGSPFAMINEAIANVAQMQSIDLSLEETQKVADYLIAGGAGSMPTDNKGRYDVFCSVCHGIGGHGGKFKAVTGASQQMITESIGQIPWMQPLVLDQAQIQGIADYLTAGGEPPLPTDGVALYGVYCAVCHGDGGHGGKFKPVTGASKEMISRAIIDELWMSSLQITAGQLQSIAAYLGAGGEPPQPSTGAGLYEVFCAVCHGVGGHGGKFKVVTGASNEMITEAIINEPWMGALQLMPAQQQQIADYLAAGGGGSKPVDGAGLYKVYCETCHGPDGSGGPEEDVRGESADSIRSAIQEVKEMWHLLSYVTTSGSQNDAVLISDYLNGQQHD